MLLKQCRNLRAIHCVLVASENVQVQLPSLLSFKFNRLEGKMDNERFIFTWLCLDIDIILICPGSKYKRGFKYYK